MGNKPSEQIPQSNSSSDTPAAVPPIVANPGRVSHARVTLFGESIVGKTALVAQFVSNVFVQEHDPTVEDSYRKQLAVEDNMFMFDILDTCGSEEYTSLRDQNIRRTEGFILVYSVTNRASFDKCIEWYQQILRVKDEDSVPLVLVGNKTDLVADRVVTTAQGEEIAKQHGWRFIETSAKNRINVDEAFIAIAQLIDKRETTVHKGKK